jgi:dynein heavy chain, axonemal
MACRNDAVESWTRSCKEAGIPSSEHFSFSTALGDPVQIRQWNIWGLPKDDFSCCNGIIISHSNRWPLCIDPQGQTNKWVRTMHAGSQLVVVKLTGAKTPTLRVLPHIMY